MVLVVIKAKAEILEALERARGLDPDAAADGAWRELEEHLVGLAGDWVAVVRTAPDADACDRVGEEGALRSGPSIRYVSLEDLAATSGLLHEARAGVAPAH
jgi:hypothetical protein